MVEAEPGRVGNWRRGRGRRRAVDGVARYAGIRWPRGGRGSVASAPSRAAARGGARNERLLDLEVRRASRGVAVSSDWRASPRFAIGASIRPVRQPAHPDESKVRRSRRAVGCGSLRRSYASSDSATTSGPEVSRSSRPRSPAGPRPRPRRRARAGRGRACRSVSRPGMDDDARRLVDDEQVLVLPDDVEVHLLGRERPGLGGQLDVDLLPALEPVALRPRLAVDETAPSAISRSASARERPRPGRREPGRAARPQERESGEWTTLLGGRRLERSPPASAPKRIRRRRR